MRNTKFFILSLFCLLIVPTLYGQSKQNIDISLTNSTLKELIGQIESQTDYSFMFNSTVDLNTKVSVTAKGESIKDLIAN